MANDLTGNPLKIDTPGAGDLLGASAPVRIAGFLWDPGVTPVALNQATSAANSAQSPSIPQVPGKALTINEVILFASGAGTVTLTITDGSSNIGFGTVSVGPAPVVIQVNHTFANGSLVQFNVGAAGVGVTTTISAVGVAVPEGAGCIVTDSAGHVLFQGTTTAQAGAPVSHMLGTEPGAGLLASGLKVPTLGGVLLIYLA